VVVWGYYVEFTGRRGECGARGDERAGARAGGVGEAEAGLEPDEDQRRVLESTRRRGLLNCTRQWGKSTITAAKSVHHAWNQKGSLTLVVSPSARQSGEFVRKAAEFARRLGMATKGDGDNETSLAFPNGSRIVGLPGSEATIRGFSAVTLLLVDEAARVSDELYRAIRPMLAVSDGTLWLMSTPFGKRGFFWEAWEKSGEDCERVRVTGYSCARIRREFLEEERKVLGNGAFGRSIFASSWIRLAGCLIGTWWRGLLGQTLSL